MAAVRRGPVVPPLIVDNSENTNNNNNNNNSSLSSRSMNNTSTGLVQKYLTNCRSLYSCIYCRTHLANHDELVSRSFQGNHGRAYLFNSVINVSCGQAVQRYLNTGSHAVADIFCSNCQTTLGWKYEKAYVEAQKYKEGKFIIELAHVIRENRHLEMDKGERLLKGILCGQPSDKSSHLGHKPNFHMSDAASAPPGIANVSSETIKINKNKSDHGTSFHDDYDDDEELMFPLYEDLYNSKFTVPSSLSSSQHSRIRRSLYLNSTPYDWKSSSSPNQSVRDENTLSNKPKLASSVCSSDLSPSTSSSPWSSSGSSSPSSSSSRCSSSGISKKSSPPLLYENNLNENNSMRPLDTTKKGHLSSGYDSEKSSKCEEDYQETQFKFEDEVIDQQGHFMPATGSCFDCVESQSNLIRLNLEPGGTPDERPRFASLDKAPATNTEVESETGPSIEEKTMKINNSGHNNSPQHHKPQNQQTTQQIPPSEAAGPSLKHKSAKLSHQLSSEDEEFFDCCSGHEVTSQ